MVQFSAVRPNHNARAMARGLGWFSLALGLTELVAPGTIKRNVGTPGPKGVLQAYGAREIAGGLAILASDRPVRMVWARVAGDLLDLATLLPALSKSNPKRLGGEAAFAFVALATAMDLYVALHGDDIAGSGQAEISVGSQQTRKALPAPLNAHNRRADLQPADSEVL
jgi:hypothetical protein